MSEFFLNKNTNVVELANLKDVLGGNYLTASTVVNVTVKDNGVAIAGEAWPKAMSYIGVNGRFAATISADIVFDVTKEYECIVTAFEASSGFKGQWSENVPVFDRGNN